VRADLGNLHRLMHRNDEAVQELREANDLIARTATDTNTSRPLALSELAEAELDDGNADAALAAATQALAMARKVLPAKHYLLGVPLFALARVDLARGRADEAEPLLREALAVRTPPHPAEDLRVIEVKVALVRALSALGRKDDQKELRAQIESVLRTSTSPYAADLRARLAAARPLAAMR
jgi:serine/threonine-protein kinase